MPWTVRIAREFEVELKSLSGYARTEILAHASLLEQFGPGLGRPWVDTLKGSRHPNMKELRFKLTDGPWRVAFAFDLHRQAILLSGACKSGMNERRFYQGLIRRADARFEVHLRNLRKDS